MDGSTASIIAIPIVATLALAAWLLLVAYAAAHPQPGRHPGKAGQASGLNQCRVLVPAEYGSGA
jgi:hypothetical protein